MNNVIDTTIYKNNIMANNNNTEKDNLVEYRLDKLEAGFTEIAKTLTELKNVVLRMEERFSNSNFSPINCSMHSQKIDQYAVRLDAVEKEVSEIKTYMQRAIGALIVISLIIQLVGPVIADNLHFGNHNNNPPQESSLVIVTNR
jgi:hypothetical protein